MRPHPGLVAIALCCGCSGGGAGAAPDADPADGADVLATDAPSSDAPSSDAPSSDAPSSDAPALDAPAIDAGIAVDAPWGNLCAQYGVAPTPITSPTVMAPPFRYIQEFDNPGAPAYPYMYVSLLELTTPVALDALSFGGSWNSASPESAVLADCGGAVVATGARHTMHIIGPLGDVEWFDGHTGPIGPGTYLVKLAQTPWSGLFTSTVDLHGAIAAGEACTDPLVAAGVLSCRPGSSCVGGICVAAECSDGVDDDGDGLDDAADPGCESVGDATEADACATGGPCAACVDGADDDGDNAVDWPADLGCDQPGDPDESNCPDPSPTLEIGGGPVGLHLAGAPSVHRLCGSIAADGPERLFHVRFATAGHRLTFAGPLGAFFLVFHETCDGAAPICAWMTPESPTESTGPLLAGDYYIAAYAGVGGDHVSVSW